jgi:predicted thioredoxin/glutaredoxin
LSTRIVIHPTCAASYEAVKALAREGLLEKVELITAEYPQVVLHGSVWSVPWILVDGMPAATDPVDPGEVVEIVAGTWQRRLVDPVEAYMSTVLHSAYAAAVAYLHGSLEPVIDEALASASVRSPLSGTEPAKVVEEVKARAGELYRLWEDKIMRALGISYVRELWWASRGELGRDELREVSSPLHVASWLIAKASIGRGGLPGKPLPAREKAEKLATFVRRGAAGLLAKIRREQEKILGDEEYWRILVERASSL